MKNGPRHPHGPPHRIPPRVRRAWWRTRRGIRRRLFVAFGVAIVISIASSTCVHRLVGHGVHARPATALLAFGLTFFVLWGFAGAVSAHLAFPIIRLVEIVRAFGEGALDRRARVPRRAPAEVRELGDAFDAMADRIEKQIAGQRELLAAVSHELRTPLARLRLVLELGRERGADARLLEEAEAEIGAIDELVASLLAGARLDAGAIALRPVDLVAIARDAVARASEANKTRSYALEAEGPVMVRADPALVVRALGILLDNATKHGGPNIIVEVSVDGTLEVEDDGPGIPETDRARVLQPFVRGEGKAYDETRGIGLGLHLLDRIAEAHGTGVTIEPVSPHGVRVGIGPFELVG